MNGTKNYLYYTFITLVILTVATILLLTFKSGNNKYFYYNEGDIQSYTNHKWMYNVNIFQYSTYLIIVTDSTWRVEMLIMIHELVDNDLTCLLQTKSDSQRVELKIIETYRLVLDHIYKIVCLVDLKHDLKDVAFAVINKNDFKEMPMSMFNYQNAKIIHEQNPRLKKVGVCVNYVPNVYAGIYNWVQMHENFGVAEIAMHDASESQALKKLIYPKFKSDFVDIRDYNLDIVCETEQIALIVSMHPEYEKSYKLNCLKFRQNRLLSNDGGNNHLSVNDCYASLSYKYEFVTLYDLDELVIPRSHNIMDIVESNEAFACADINKSCKYKPIVNYYDYLKGIIKTELQVDISRLRSIAFHHSAYLLPNNIQNSLMANLKEIAVKIKSGNRQFPMILKTSVDSLTFAHEFTINEWDKDYALYFSNIYDEITCIFDKKIKIKSKNLANQWMRYIYFHTHYDQRFPKSVHYTMNVKGLFTHDAAYFTKDSLIINANKTNGHMNSHFRGDLSGFTRQAKSSSIRNIGIDFDYVLFLLQDFTELC